LKLITSKSGIFIRVRSS